jgi:hypothetical protein
MMLGTNIMRVLLRRKTNGFYFQGAGRWINNPDKGFDFGSIHQAVEFAGKADSHGLELALAFDDSSLISAVSIEAAQADLTRRCSFSHRLLSQ